MRYYNRKRKSSGKGLRIFLRIMYVLAVAAVVTAITLAIGNRLQKKVKRLEEVSQTVQVSTGLQTERKLEETALFDEYSPTVFGAGIDISDYLDANTSDDGTEGAEYPADIADDVKKIAEHYDTLTVDLMDEDGGLIYLSHAMCDITRIPYSGESEEEKLIKAAVSAAKKEKLRTCAVIVPVISETTLSGAAAVDSALIEELAGFGFDEVLFDLTKSFTGEIDEEAAGRLRTYIHECSSLTEDACMLGVILSSDTYLNPANAKQIQVIANSSSFIAVWFDLDEVYITTKAYNTVSEAVTSLLGNFSVYNMRVMIDSRFDIISGAVYCACTSHGVNNISFSHFISPDKLVYDDGTGTHPDSGDNDSDEEDKSAPVSNPYASSADNPSIGASDNKKDEKTETDEQPDGDNSSHPWY